MPDAAWTDFSELFAFMFTFNYGFFSVGPFYSIVVYALDSIKFHRMYKILFNQSYNLIPN